MRSTFKVNINYRFQTIFESVVPFCTKYYNRASMRRRTRRPVPRGAPPATAVVVKPSQKDLIFLLLHRAFTDVILVRGVVLYAFWLLTLTKI